MCDNCVVVYNCYVRFKNGELNTRVVHSQSDKSLLQFNHEPRKGDPIFHFLFSSLLPFHPT